jgi:TM2 domain-containing membrane protein YozV
MPRCPYCEGEISETATKCRHCGEWVTPPTPVDPDRREGGVPAGIASFFLPGLGQFLTGRPKMGAGYFVMAFFAWWVMLGWVVHLIAAYDATKGGTDSMSNFKKINEFKGPWSD